MLWGGQGGGAFPGRPSRPNGGNSYDSCQSGSSDSRHQRHYSCRELLCVALVPCVLLSLVAIGICSLLIYFHLLQEYQSKIDRLQAELQAVRDKDGAVFLPQEMYEEQTKKLESQEEEIKAITKEIKALETERDELVVRIFGLFTTDHFVQCVSKNGAWFFKINGWGPLKTILSRLDCPNLMILTL